MHQGKIAIHFTSLLKIGLLGYGLLGSLAFGASPVSSKKTKLVKPLPSPVVVMAYNVENLFDTSHDEGKDDWTYLPLAIKSTPEHLKICKETSSSKSRTRECENFDWSESELKIKLDRIGQVVSKANGGQCADILFLEEIENIKILERLRTEYLKDCHYKPGILLEGDDRRGIDSALLSRFDLKGEAQLHKIRFTDQNAEGDKPQSRGILEAQFALPSGEILTALAVHFPAPYHPFTQRKEAMEQLSEIADRASLKSDLVIAAGDFNTNAKEDSLLYRGIASRNWYVSHLEGCKQCLGSHYFQGDKNWSFLDAIMLFKKAKERPNYKWILDPESVQIVNNQEFQTNKEAIPQGWENSATPGLSDHLPLLLRLQVVEKKP